MRGLATPHKSRLKPPISRIFIRGTKCVARFLFFETISNLCFVLLNCTMNMMQPVISSTVTQCYGVMAIPQLHASDPILWSNFLQILIEVWNFFGASWRPKQWNFISSPKIIDGKIARLTTSIFLRYWPYVRMMNSWLYENYRVFGACAFVFVARSGLKASR